MARTPFESISPRQGRQIVGWGFVLAMALCLIFFLGCVMK